MRKVSENSLKNLKPVKTSDEAKALGKKGGIKSGEVRRERKKLQETVSTILSMAPGLEADRQALKQLGIDESDQNNQTLLVLSMMRAAAEGDVKAATWLRDTAGEKPIEKLEANVQASISPLDEKLAELSIEELREMAGLDDK